jgi:hypothetical protein
MKLAGVDGVIVDWYGIAQTADYPPIHEASRALFGEAGRQDMKFAACYEDRSIELMVKWGELDASEAAGHLAETMQWMQSNWFTAPQYLRVEGRPLLLNFGPIYMGDAEAWDAAFEALPVRPNFFALHHLWRNVDADGGFMWVHHDPWEGTPSQEKIRRRIGEVFTYSSSDPKEIIVSAYPGFNDVYVEGHRELAHRDGQTLHETLDVAMEGPWEIIQLVTWNDYGEGTMIEPTHEFGYTFLEVIQEARRKEVAGLFPFTAADLRLPARLYALRKEGDVPKEILDRIGDLLNKGACDAARQLLDEI